MAASDRNSMLQVTVVQAILSQTRGLFDNNAVSANAIWDRKGVLRIILLQVKGSFWDIKTRNPDQCVLNCSKINKCPLSWRARMGMGLFGCFQTPYSSYDPKNACIGGGQRRCMM